MDEGLLRRIEWRKKMLVSRGVAEDVIATLNLLDDGGKDKLVFELSEDKEGVLQIEVCDNKQSASSKNPYLVTVDVLDTMLGALVASRRDDTVYSKLWLLGPGTFFLPNKFSNFIGQLSDVIAKHLGPHVTHLAISPFGHFLEPEDHDHWLNFLLGLVGQFPFVSKLELGLICGPEIVRLFAPLPPLLPNLEALELREIWWNHVDPVLLAGFINGFQGLNTLVVQSSIVDGLESDRWHPALFGSSTSLKHLIFQDEPNRDPDEYEEEGRRLADIVGSLPGLETLQIGFHTHFEPLKLAIQAHPAMKSFTWSYSIEYVSEGIVLPDAMIQVFPNLKSITCLGVLYITHPDGMGERILEAIEASDNLQSFCMPQILIPKNPGAIDVETSTESDWKIGTLDELTKKAILYKLGINRAKALLGDNPTMRQWVVAMVAFRHQPAILDYLLQEGLGDGPSDWVPHALEGIGPSKNLAWRHCSTDKNLAQYKCARDEEEVLGQKTKAFQQAQFEWDPDYKHYYGLLD